jgi:hypothetical protein
MTMERSVRRNFEHLAMQRSPENLSCDGELNRRQIQSRHRAIMAEWKELEKLMGRKVSLDEIERGMCERV